MGGLLLLMLDLQIFRLNGVGIFRAFSALSMVQLGGCTLSAGGLLFHPALAEIQYRCAGNSCFFCS